MDNNLRKPSPAPLRDLRRGSGATVVEEHSLSKWDELSPASTASSTFPPLLKQVNGELVSSRQLLISNQRCMVLIGLLCLAQFVE